MARARGSIRRRGPNAWEVRYEEAQRTGGNRRSRSVTIKGSRAEALKELTRLLRDADTGKLLDAARGTVADRIEAWLAGAHDVAPRTRERYAELATHQVLPHLGGVALPLLKPTDIRAWHAKLLAAGLAPRTILHAHRVLCQALDGTQARTAMNVKLPLIEEEEVEILDPPAVARVLETLKGNGLLPIVTLALMTGARRGEILGLMWSDVDLEAGTLKIERSVEETKAGLRLKPPKTKRGRRTLSLPPEAVDMLRAHKVQQLELRIQLGMGKPDKATLLFSTVDGELLRPRNVTKAWSRLVPEYTFHALRHTHASMLIHAGVDIITVSRRLGHASASITLNIYGHLCAGADEAAAEAIGRVLR
jgi:integrase